MWMVVERHYWRGGLVEGRWDQRIHHEAGVLCVCLRVGDSMPIVGLGSSRRQTCCRQATVTSDGEHDSVCMSQFHSC